MALELKEDVREEAETIGTVTNIHLFDVSLPSALFRDMAAEVTLSAEPVEGGRGSHDDQVQGCYLGASMSACKLDFDPSMLIRSVLTATTSLENERAFLWRQAGMCTSPGRLHRLC